jgi:hypothetical protein
LIFHIPSGRRELHRRMRKLTITSYKDM